MNIIIHPEKHNERMNARLSSARSDDELLSSVVRAVLFLKILYLSFLFIIISMKSKTTREISFDVISFDPPPSLFLLNRTNFSNLTNERKKRRVRVLFSEHRAAFFSRDRENASRVFAFFVVRVAKRRRRRADEDGVRSFGND